MVVKGNIKAVGVANDNAEDKTKWKWVMMFGLRKPRCIRRWVGRLKRKRNLLSD